MRRGSAHAFVLVEWEPKILWVGYAKWLTCHPRTTCFLPLYSTQDTMLSKVTGERFSDGRHGYWHSPMASGSGPGEDHRHRVPFYGIRPCSGAITSVCAGRSACSSAALCAPPHPQRAAVLAARHLAYLLPLGTGPQPTGLTQRLHTPAHATCGGVPPYAAPGPTGLTAAWPGHAPASGCGLSSRRPSRAS